MNSRKARGLEYVQLKNAILSCSKIINVRMLLVWDVKINCALIALVLEIQYLDTIIRFIERNVSIIKNHWSKRKKNILQAISVNCVSSTDAQDLKVGRNIYIKYKNYSQKI